MTGSSLLLMEGVCTTLTVSSLLLWVVGMHNADVTRTHTGAHTVRCGQHTGLYPPDPS